METVEVWRGEPATDVDGNPVQGDLKLVNSFTGMVAPVSADRSDMSMPVTLAYTVYLRGEEASGIQDTDLLMVRGRLLPVKGVPQVWCDLHGRHVGDVVSVGYWKETDGEGQSGA